MYRQKHVSSRFIHSVHSALLTYSLQLQALRCFTQITTRIFLRTCGTKKSHHLFNKIKFFWSKWNENVTTYLNSLHLNPSGTKFHQLFSANQPSVSDIRYLRKKQRSLKNLVELNLNGCNRGNNVHSCRYIFELTWFRVRIVSKNYIWMIFGNSESKARLFCL